MYSAMLQSRPCAIRRTAAPGTRLAFGREICCQCHATTIAIFPKRRNRSPAHAAAGRSHRASRASRSGGQHHAQPCLDRVSDIARTKAFYDAALQPLAMPAQRRRGSLGYGKDPSRSDQRHAPAVTADPHRAAFLFRCTTARASRPSTRRACRWRRDNGKPGPARITATTTMPPSSSIGRLSIEAYAACA